MLAAREHMPKTKHNKTRGRGKNDGEWHACIVRRSGLTRAGARTEALMQPTGTIVRYMYL